MVAAYLDYKLVFPVLVTAQYPGLIVWSIERKQILLLELTVPWEENTSDDEERKSE